MKTKITVIFVICITAFAFRFFNKTELVEITSLLPDPDTTFIIGVLESGAEGRYDRQVDSLGINLWHRYPSGTNNGWITAHNGWIPFDFTDAEYEEYHEGVEDIIRTNRDSGMYTLMNRGKILRLCFGQRSDYQCEEVGMVNPDYWFYTYKNRDNILSDSNKTGADIVDNSVFGNGIKVVRCSTLVDQPGYVVKGLKANREQINCIASWGSKAVDESYIWHIKPKIRIDSSSAQTLNREIPVCRIIVNDFNGDIIKIVTLRVRHFLNSQDQYNGKYIEEFNYGSNDTTLTLDTLLNDPFNPNCENLWEESCAVDFKVYWYGQCDMWIDYVRVDNEIAHNLFSNNLQNPQFVQYQNWLKWEADSIATLFPNAAYRFYIEEFEFNQIPCMEYVSRKIDTLDGENNFGLMCNLNYSTFKIHTPGFDTVKPSAEYIKRTLVDRLGSKEIFMGAYGILSHGENGLNNYVPNTLPVSNYDPPDRTGQPVSVTQYEDWLQSHLDADRNEWYDFTSYYKLARNISNLADIPFINLIQAHSWYSLGHRLREPLNNEISLLSYLGISYGAKGMIYYVMTSTDSGQYFDNFSRGLGEAHPTLGTYSGPRYTNAYGQEKWKSVCELNQKIKKIAPLLMSFDQDYNETYIYRIASERNAMSANTYIDKLKAFPAFEFAPDPIPDLSNEVPETNTDAYLQAAFFEKENPGLDKSKFFMIVNRRCSPFISYTSANNIGGRRLVTMKINPTYLSGFNNWKIFDLETGDTVRTLSKSDTSFVFLGDFMPGEGKLYKIAPVMQEGGTLVTNEDCSGNFDCKGVVNNSGFDINIRPGTTINFADSLARIVMTGGDFKSGNTPSENTAPVYLEGKYGKFWKGLQLQNCPSVEIVRTYFKNISPYELDSTYALDITDCRFVNISSCSFVYDPAVKAGGVRASFISENEFDIDVFIFNNNFEMDPGDVPALSIVSSGYTTFPVIIEGNNFESYYGNSANAILISGIAGGAIKSNTITGYKNGIILIWSAMDFYRNIITGGNDDSKGILSYASSGANLGPDGKAFTGGFNSISCEGENAKCIDVDISFLYLDQGLNTFNLINYDFGSAFHLSGNITDEAYSDPVDATENCFRLSQYNADAVHNMIWTSMQEPINFNFLDYHCDSDPGGGMIAFDLGNGMYDTIYTESGGSGGGKSNYELRNRNYELRANIELITVKSLEDSVSLNLRKRDYSRVSEICYELLTDHIDSLKDVTIISKLYLAELRLDSSGNRITNLKSFLEALILNNPDKETLVKQSFYVIQKCKVSLEMFESAMSGFQQIVNQNPYSYEGLVASWDYSATSLLSGGQGGGERDLEFGISDLEFENLDFGIGDKPFDNKSQIQNPKFQILDDDPKDKYDTKKFTKEDRKAIKENVYNSFQTRREIEIEKVKSLEKKVMEGNASKTERSELKVKKTLGEVIKVRKPIDVTEHINNVNGNIQKVFGSTKGHNSKEVINTIPTEYSLSQNYPNPFNPVTKISFDLPQDGNVKLIIYDLLGREITRLLNNEFRVSGRYTVDFNGSNLSSGIYFYRIETDGFIATKMMMLLK